MSTGLHSGLSDFGQQLALERESLLSVLIERLAGVQAGDEEHAALLEACQDTLQHHKYGGTNPRDVDDVFDRLGDRFGEHAQFDKQRALQLLKRHMMGLEIHFSQYEFQHRLLSFLYATSQSPLAALYLGSKLVQQLEHQAQHAVVGPPTYLSDDDIDSWTGAEEHGVYTSGSELSEWSEAESRKGTDSGMDGEDSADGDSSGGNSDEELEEGAGVTSAAALVAGTLAQQQLTLPPPPLGPLGLQQQLQLQQQPRRPSPYTRGSLSVWLASKQTGGHPARVLQPNLCFHERELLEQVIYMLTGVNSPGAAFELDLATDTYTPCAGVHLHNTSQGSLRALLLRFAQAATAIRQMQSFCSAALQAGINNNSSQVAVADASGPVESEQQRQRRLLALPTAAAFAAAVSEQQQALQQQLLVIETAYRSGALLSLLQLQQRTAGLAQQAELLAALVRRCCWHGSPAETSAALLSHLHEALQQQLLQARSQGGVLASMLLRIFTAACRPLLVTLHKWLYRGVLDDPHAEFFIQATGTDIPTDSPRFWSDAYTLRATTASLGAPGDSVPAAPCFLLPLADSILAAGKSTLLLQAYSNWRLAAAAAASAVRRPGVGTSAATPLAVSGGVSASASAANSPSKRRLSEFGALGFAIAGQQEQHPYGVPPPVLPADVRAALLKEAAAGGGGSGDGPEPEPLLLHQQLMQNLESQLREHLACATAPASTSIPHMHQQEQQEQQEQHVHDEQQQQQQQQPQTLLQSAKAQQACPPAVVSTKENSATAGNGGAPGSEGGSGSNSGGGGGGSGHPNLEEWLEATAGDDTVNRLLPPADTLPPLPSLPASIEELPAAQAATIAAAPPAGGAAEPSADAAAADGMFRPVSAAGEATSLVTTGAGSQLPPAAASSSSSSQGPSMAERMRQAAAARAQQAGCTAAEQLSLLMAPPAPLPNLALPAAVAGTASCAILTGTGAGNATADAKAAGAGDASTAAAVTAAAPAGAAAAAAGAPEQFDGSTWQLWYQHVAAALSQQLHVLDALGGGIASSCGSSSTRRRKLISSYGVPLGLPSFSGSAVDQLWGRDGSADLRSSNSSMLDAAAVQRHQQPLLQPSLVAQAPPLDVLLQHSLLRPVQAQVESASSALCTALLRHGLLRQLSALRDTYLLGSPLLEPFVAFLLRKISTLGGIERTSEFELNSALQDALAAGGKAGLLRISAQILPAAAAGAGTGPGTASRQRPQQAGLPRVQQLARLRVRVEPGWPLSLLVGEPMLEQYNAVLVLLLQLRWVKASLKSVRYSRWKAGKRSSQGGCIRDGLQHQMVHLVDAVHQYITDRVMAAGTWLEQAIEECTSLDEMHRCRSKYLRAVTRYCLLSTEGVARLVHEGILHLLNACLHYCSLHRQRESIAAALQTLAEQAESGAALLGGGAPQHQAAGAADGEEDPAAAAAGTEGLQQRSSGRRAELAKRAGELQQQLVQLRRDFGNRQRLLLRVLHTKAAEAGSHADELRQLLGALDFNRYFEAIMA